MPVIKHLLLLPISDCQSKEYRQNKRITTVFQCPKLFTLVCQVKDIGFLNKHRKQSHCTFILIMLYLTSDCYRCCIWLQTAIESVWCRIEDLVLPQTLSEKRHVALSFLHCVLEGQVQISNDLTIESNTTGACIRWSGLIRSWIKLMEIRKFLYKLQRIYLYGITILLLVL